MQFVYLPGFVKKLKEYSRKYPSIRKDFESLLQLLHKSPRTGTPLGKDCYKIRMAIKSKGKGKSGGARVITCVRVLNDSIYFLTIYDKSEREAITNTDLKVFIDHLDKL